MTSSRARLAPLKPEAWSDETRALLGVALQPASERKASERKASERKGEAGGSASGTPNILRTLCHHPTLLAPFLRFSATLALRGVLSRRASELLALRTAWNCQSAFEWGHHVVHGRAAGLSAEQIARIATRALSDAWAPEDRLLLRAADEMHGQQDVSDTTWSELEAAFSPAQLVEIPFVVGQYTMLSMVANTTGVTVEEGLEPLPAP